MARKKRKHARTMANRLAWGLPFFGIALVLLVLAIWQPWYGKIGRLQREGVRTWAVVTDAEIHINRVRHRHGVTLEYTIQPGEDQAPITAREVIATHLMDVLLRGAETPGHMEVVYLPDDPRTNCLAATLPFKGSQLGVLAFLLGGLALLIAMVGLAALTLTKQEILDILRGEGK